MRVLVTGGAGFIGSHYVRSALSGRLRDLADAEIVVLDKLTYAGDLANLAPVAGSERLRFVQGDIVDSALVDRLVAEVDQVVHFAAESHVDRSITGPAAFVMTNVVGTQALLQAALEHDVTRFVHVSTDEVYGSVDVGAASEHDPLQPTSPYAASKASSDLLALAFHRTYGLPVLVTRCTNNYGPYQLPEKLIPRFVTRLLSGQRVPLYGDGRQVRDWLHVDDHCRAVDLVRSQGRPGEVYNIGGGTERTNRQVTELLLRHCGADWDRVEQVADRLGHDQRYSLDTGKVESELGFAPRTPFEEGLVRTVLWFQENHAWWSRAVARLS